MPHPKNEQDKNINPNISRQASHRHSKHTTSHSPAHQRGINSPPPSRMPNISSSQHKAYTNHWTNLTHESRDQKELWPYSLEKRDLKHSKLEKRKRQRNIVQMKEQGENSQAQTNEEEIGKLHEKEFREMIVKMVQNNSKDLENRMEKMQELTHLTRINGSGGKESVWRPRFSPG